MRCVAVIPIKLNNKRLPGKNIKPFTNGDPLCTYIIKTLKKVRQIDRIIVYCSDDSIIEYLPSGVEYIKRNPELDSDNATMNEILQSFAKLVDSDIYLLTHATAPFITSDSISSGIAAVMSGEYDSSFSVIPCHSFMWKDGVPMNYSLEHIPRTQDLEPLFVETCGFYCFSKDLILNANRRIGYNPKLIEVSKLESIDIDELEDFIMADALYNYLRTKENEQFH